MSQALTCIWHTEILFYSDNNKLIEYPSSHMPIVNSSLVGNYITRARKEKRETKTKQKSHDVAKRSNVIIGLMSAIRILTSAGFDTASLHQLVPNDGAMRVERTENARQRKPPEPNDFCAAHARAHAEAIYTQHSTDLHDMQDESIFPGNGNGGRSLPLFHGWSRARWHATFH